MADSSLIIYVVDDDRFIREALHSLLKSAGYEVEVFESIWEISSKKYN